jgi:hypothetical protein
LQERAIRLHSLRICWWASQHLQQLQPVLQALTVPAGMQEQHLRLQELVLHVQLDAAGAPLVMIAELLARTPQLRRLELPPVYTDAALCSSPDSTEAAAACSCLLDTVNLHGLTALALNSAPPAFALMLAQHSNLQQLSVLELRDLQWSETPAWLSAAAQAQHAAGRASRIAANSLLAAIADNMQGLRQLSFSHSAFMHASTAAFKQLAAALTQLTALDLAHCPALLTSAPGQETAMLGFHKLQSLKVRVLLWLDK